MGRRSLSLLAVLDLCALVACGDDGNASDTVIPPGITDGTAGASTGDDTDSATGGQDADGTADGSDSSTGVTDTCSAECDGECIDGVCCPLPLSCNEVCCGETEVCSFQQCVVPGDECVDATDCPDENYCEYSLGEPGSGGKGGMCQGGFTPATGKCLPTPPQCPAGVEPEGDDVDCLPECEVIPPTSFAPVLKYHWDQGNSMMAPIILPLDDDNCDGTVDERDIPEIVFTTFEGSAYNDSGTLHAISIVDGQVVDKWSVSSVGDTIHPGRSIAGGNIDTTPGNEIITCTAAGNIRAFDHDGSELWTAPSSACHSPSIVDLDQDGTAEILGRSVVLDGATGALEFALPVGGTYIAADVNGDGLLEVVNPQGVYGANGALLASSGLAGTYPAVADFDGDGAAEIVAINNPSHTLELWRLNAAMPGGVEIIRQGININGALAACGGDTGGGAPTIADFNGDGTPDVGVAAGVGYAVFDGAALMNPAVANPDTLLWITPAQDCSSRSTGSSVFDFDGNGSAEVVYGDEQYMRIYDGETGGILLQECNTTGTLFEYPLVADVDNDGHADIIVIANDYHSILCPSDDSQQRGLRVFGDAAWVRTRRIWNQHAYHVTNVEEDGTIPTVETPNWTVERLNNFRQNVQPEGEFSAPDLVVSVLGICEPDAFGVTARVRNLGRAAVPAGVPVGFYEGDPAAGGALLGLGATSKILYPAEAQDIPLLIDDPSNALAQGDTEVWVVVDDNAPPHPWTECRIDNNVGHGSIACNIAG